MDNDAGIAELRQRTRSRMVEEFIPSSGWTEDADSHYLLVDLPDFRKEEVKLQVDNSGHITVSGERKVRDNNYSYFEKTHQLPENADINMITGKFDGEILCVTVPKKKFVDEEQHNEIAKSQGGADQGDFDKENSSSEEHESEHGSDSDSSEKNNVGRETRDDERKCEHEKGYIFSIWMGKLCKNKGIIVTAIFAFSAGVLVTRKFG